MTLVWDYEKNSLKRSQRGRILLLERMINFGPSKMEVINLSLVKKYWDKLNLFPNTKRLMELFIWGKPRS